MPGDNQTPFFELINKMFDHVSKIEPRLVQVEWKMRILWWAVATIGSGIGAIILAILVEWLKKKVIGQ